MTDLSFVDPAILNTTVLPEQKVIQGVSLMKKTWIYVRVTALPHT